MDWLQSFRRRHPRTPPRNQNAYHDTPIMEERRCETSRAPRHAAATRGQSMTNPAMPAQPPVHDHYAPALLGLAAIMTSVSRGEDLAHLGDRLMRAAAGHSGAARANPLLDLSLMLFLKQAHDVALRLQTEALNLQQCYHLPATGAPAKGDRPIRLLAFMGPGDLTANTPLEFLIQDSDIDLTMLFVAPWLPFPERVPEHDVAFVAIGESRQSLPTLALVERLLERWPRPVLNAPGRIARLSRDRVSALLKAVPGVQAPSSLGLTRTVLEPIAHGQQPLSNVLQDGDFPLIVRPRDSHGGKRLQKVHTPAELAAYLQTTPEAEFFLSPFVDYRSPDGQFRKYRIVLIDGRPYACYMAISEHWVVHYRSGGMADEADKRA